MSVLNKYAKMLGGEARHNRIACPGPGHSRDDRSLSVTFSPDGSFTTHSFAGDDFRTCRDHVKDTLGLGDREPQPLPSVEPASAALLLSEHQKVERALRIWESALPMRDTLAETYLVSRGVTYAGDALRFHPSCPFGPERHPAMVALMTNVETAKPTGIHRTALLPDGSGKASPGKKMLGIARSAVVRLTADAEVTDGLGIAEGIETALATPYRPIWACLSAGTMFAMPVLSGVGALTIFADHDPTGIEAANECGMRWHEAGREVTIVAPVAIGTDFADQRAA